MNKINFENLPGTNTPINAENLNAMQDNIEDEINNLYDKMENVKILWTGTSLMMADQQANLSDNISHQNNGIVLIWSPYQNGQTQNWGYVHTFISKYQLQFTGKGVNCQLIHNDFSLVACKYVYIGDSVITGSSDNTRSGIGSGITFNNNAFVLRAVIGV